MTLSEAASALDEDTAFAAGWDRGCHAMMPWVESVHSETVSERMSSNLGAQVDVTLPEKLGGELNMISTLIVLLLPSNDNTVLLQHLQHLAVSLKVRSVRLL